MRPEFLLPAPVPRPVGRDLEEVIKRGQGAEKNVRMGGGLGVQALPKGVHPSLSLPGGRAQEHLRPRAQNCLAQLRPQFLSALPRPDPRVPPPTPERSCAQEGTPRFADWRRCCSWRPADLLSEGQGLRPPWGLPSSREKVVPRVWGQIPGQSPVEGVFSWQLQEKSKPLLFIEHLLFTLGDTDDVSALSSS